MKEKQVIPYKQSILIKIKNYILSIFKRKNTTNHDYVDKKDEINNDKQEILKLYELVKQDCNNIETIESDKLYKIMLLLNEEINMLNDRMNIEVSGIKEELRKINNIYINS